MFEEALNMNNLDVDLEVIDDGEVALNKLKNHKNETVDLDLIILDINLPKVSGKEILKEIKQHKYLDNVPKIILSTSNLLVDMEYCYGHEANCFLTKPNDVFEFFNLVKSVVNYWCIVPKSLKSNTQGLAASA